MTGSYSQILIQLFYKSWLRIMITRVLTLSCVNNMCEWRRPKRKSIAVLLTPLKYVMKEEVIIYIKINYSNLNKHNEVHKWSIATRTPLKSSITCRQLFLNLLYNTNCLVSSTAKYNYKAKHTYIDIIILASTA